MSLHCPRCDAPLDVSQGHCHACGRELEIDEAFYEARDRVRVPAGFDTRTDPGVFREPLDAHLRT